MSIWKYIIDWSEVWALFFPLAIILYKRSFEFYLKPIVWYVIVAIILNFSQDYIWMNGIELWFASQKGDNQVIYNIHSLLRMLLFAWFFIKIKQPHLQIIKNILPVIYLVFILINFSMNEKFIEFSSLTLGIEAAILLVYCLIYFLNLLQQDQVTVYRHLPDFWVATGLCFYVVINFPIFLFYNTLAKKFEDFAIDLWTVHNLSYIIFCLFLAKAFYESDPAKNKVTIARSQSG